MLNHSLLENLKPHGDAFKSACPACRAAGADKKGNHLKIYPNDAYGCALYPKDKEHRREIFEIAGVKKHRELTPYEKREWAKEKQHRDVLKRFKSREENRDEKKNALSAELFDRIKTEHQTDCWRSVLGEASPCSFDIEDHSNNARSLIESLFPPDDFIWCGGQYDSGKEHYSRHFQTVREALKRPLLGDRISGSTFKTGSISRSKANMDKQRYTLVESDKMSFEESACLLPFFKDLGVTVRAIIHTGGKSLHFWVDYSEQTTEMLLAIAPELKLDTQAIAGSAIPLRLPGCIHEKTGNPAQLYYLNPNTNI